MISNELSGLSGLSELSINDSINDIGVDYETILISTIKKFQEIILDELSKELTIEDTTDMICLYFDIIQLKISYYDKLPMKNIHRI